MCLPHLSVIVVVLALSFVVDAGNISRQAVLLSHPYVTYIEQAQKRRKQSRKTDTVSREDTINDLWCEMKETKWSTGV